MSVNFCESFGHLGIDELLKSVDYKKYFREHVNAEFRKLIRWEIGDISHENNEKYFK
jgi:hypothetical protein